MIGSYTCACILPTTKLCYLTKLQVLIECGRSRQVRSSYQFVISFLYCQILVPIFGGLYSISLACLEISLMSKSVRTGDLFFGKLNYLSALGATFVALILLEPIVVITTAFQFQLCCILPKKKKSILLPFMMMIIITRMSLHTNTPLHMYPLVF